jgi:hypothetical protein
VKNRQKLGHLRFVWANGDVGNRYINRSWGSTVKYAISAPSVTTGCKKGLILTPLIGVNLSSTVVASASVTLSSLCLSELSKSAHLYSPFVRMYSATASGSSAGDSPRASAARISDEDIGSATVSRR